MRNFVVRPRNRDNDKCCRIFGSREINENPDCQTILRHLVVSFGWLATSLVCDCECVGVVRVLFCFSSSFTFSHHHTISIIIKLYVSQFLFYSCLI